MSLDATTSDDPTGETNAGDKLVVAGGLIAALAASSCCILPLALTVAGVGGAWMANLRALAPYQPVLAAISLTVLAYGFYRVYWRAASACDDGAICARPMPNRLVKTGLWLGAALVALALAFPLWFPVIVPYLP